MADPAAMELYMQAMAEFSVRQQQRLVAGEETSDAMEENREATAALVLLVARREELERFRERVTELTEDDAARIEQVWRELARDGEESDEGEEGEEGDDDGEFEDEALMGEAEDEDGDATDEELQDEEDEGPKARAKKVPKAAKPQIEVTAELVREWQGKLLKGEHSAPTGLHGGGSSGRCARP